MSRQLIVRPLAEQDLFGAQKWYENQRTGLGDEFRLAVDALLQGVLERPRLYPKVYRNVRRAVVRRFPYLLYFVVTPSAVIILACIHSKRDPALWKSRVR